MSKQKIEELNVLCKPVVDYLNENYDPHCSVVITDSQIRLVRDEIGIPVKKTAPEVPVQEQLVECGSCYKDNDYLAIHYGRSIVSISKESTDYSFTE